MTVLRVVVVAAGAVGTALAGLRWLRVAQREHYLPGSVVRFAGRWWTAEPADVASAVVAVAGLALSWHWPATALAPAVAAAAGPSGLGLRGRTSPLAWTRRAKTLAATVVALTAAALATAVVVGAGPLGAAATAVGAPVLVDLACLVTAPVESALAAGHVRRATARLAEVAPTVVAITGSYGKTSTKNYVAHLLAASHAVVASPASFNNRAGLARAVNENLADGTDVFVAEMGTYGPGEIAALCRWLVPDVAVITAIGPVHLERFGSIDRIVAAKSEILVPGATAVVNVDDDELAAVAAAAAADGTRVVAVSAADLPIPVADLPAGVRPTNAALAVAVATVLGVEPAAVAARLATLPVVAHRLAQATTAAGVVVLDDTYNANPAGAAAALDALGRLGQPSSRRVVVTPGMVELGRRQVDENTSFAAAAVTAGFDLVVVGHTNRAALLAGAAAAGSAATAVVSARPEAVDWVRHHLTAGDVVLYENDLPDHYP